MTPGDEFLMVGKLQHSLHFRQLPQHIYISLRLGRVKEVLQGFAEGPCRLAHVDPSVQSELEGVLLVWVGGTFGHVSYFLGG